MHVISRSEANPTLLNWALHWTNASSNPCLIFYSYDLCLQSPKKQCFWHFNIIEACFMTGRHFDCFRHGLCNRLSAKSTIKSAYNKGRTGPRSVGGDRLIFRPSYWFSSDVVFSRFYQTWLWVLMISICCLAWAIPQRCFTRDRMFSSTNLRLKQYRTYVSSYQRSDTAAQYASSVLFLENKLPRNETETDIGRSNEMPREEDRYNLCHF